MIFGSCAIKHHFPDYPKPLNDIDILSKTGTNTKDVEYHWCDAMEYVLDKSDDGFIHPDLLYTIKVSHLPWNGDKSKWWKHLSDVMFLKSKGCVLDKGFLEKLHKEWSSLFGSKDHIILSKPLDTFFKDGLNRVYDHDSLHSYFKIGEIEAYKSILKGDGTASCSETLFNELTHQQKVYTVLEEVFVISFERKLSFSNGFKHLITHLSRGWWNTFCIENSETILKDWKLEKLEYKEKLRGIK